jgi:hypothetical protein
MATSPNYVGQNVTLFCSAAAPDALSVEWKMTDADSTSPRGVYKEDLTDPDGSFTYPDFQGKVAGNLGADQLNHSLTLFRVGPDFNHSSWQCIVTTAECLEGNTSPSANLELKSKYALPSVVEMMNNSQVVKTLIRLISRVQFLCDNPHKI